MTTDYTYDQKSLVSIRSILEATGATREDAHRAATVIDPGQCLERN